VANAVSTQTPNATHASHTGHSTHTPSEVTV